MHNFFYNTYQYFVSRKWLGLGILVLLFASLIFVASKIQFEEDINKLIPTNKDNEEFQKVLKNVNFTDKIIVNITKENDASVDDLTNYASQFIDSINQSCSKYIEKIQGRVNSDDIQGTANFIYQNLPLFLDESDYETIANKIEKDSIEATTLKNYKTLISPSGLIAKDFILKDPLGLSFIALKKLRELNFGDSFTLQNGFLVSKDEKHILLFITPALETNETAENSLFVEELYATKAKLNESFKDKVSSEYFGGTLIAVANANQIKSDIQVTISIALSILLLIFIFFYRKLTVPIILFVPTIFGGLLAIVILFLIREKISAISLGIGSILLGVTLDYSLHILTHIRSNNNVRDLYKEIAKPILMSSTTTALAFLCLLFINSQALQDLGIFAAISVIGASFFALFFIPQVYKDQSQKVSKTTVFDKIAACNIHQNKWVVIVLVVFFVGSLFTYNKVVFNKDLSQLNYYPKELKTAELRLDKLINSTSKSIYIAAYGNSEETTLEVNDHILEKLDSLKAENKLINFSSIGTFVHSKKQQIQQIEKWHSFWDAKTIQNTKENLIESGTTLGFKPETFKNFYALLHTDFKPIAIEDYKAINTFSVDDYIATKDNYTTITTLVKVEDGDAVMAAFENKAQTLVIDRKQMNETFLGNLKTDFNSLIGYSLVVVIVLLILFYKSFSLTLVTGIPICLTWLLTVGIMGLFHLEFNIFNIIISTFIFGLGIDYSIFVTNGLLHEYKTGEESLATHKTSILLSVITTILGVGVLVFAKHPALYSISIVSLIGILSAVLIAFTIQPLLFKLFIGSKTKRPISFRLLIHSILSFGYFGSGGLFISLISATLLKIIPVSKKVKMRWFHKAVSKFMKSVLYTNPFLKKTVLNPTNETFEKPALIISNHTSFLDILAVGMLHPKIIFLVNDWVYNSPVFGKAVQAAGFYPVSSGIENGVSHLQEKINQGYTLMVFPEGTRSTTNKMKRFHKGAFYVAEQLNLDIIPILIHGNSEINPKGSALIRNGNLTLKILDRIPIGNKSYGDTYKQRTKNISAHFKHEFMKFREAVESDIYFRDNLFDEYRYKGDDVFQTVKKDFNTHKEIYNQILWAIDPKAEIIHISKDYGQLDFLLALNSMDRKIFSYIEDGSVRPMLQNSFITNKHKNLIFENTLEVTLKHKGNTLILNTNQLSEEQIGKVLNNTINLVILIKESRNLYAKTVSKLGFECVQEHENLMIFKR
ncbi:MMPL family transporter [Winogradskyella forsetii]|uniref:MMPL family transporter n=1 Tax=Winogradskyella forsetii TaxID=2686077 RepID=UPI0015BACCB2|nr:MMPL family transporter [Winogradskyella forsetii]